MDKSNLKVWLNGKILDYGGAKVPILTHSLQYGSGIFEGIRAYKTESGPAIFRLSDHVRRFIETAKIYSINLGYGAKEIENAIIEVVLQNKLDSCYIRPFAFYDDDDIGISVANKHVSVYIAAIPFGKYFGSAKDAGIRCKISSWKRINSDILPIRAKASGNYINSIIAGNEARASGYDEAILLSHNGYVAEGPGENIFIVRNGRLLTPGADSDILFGVTRDTIIKVAPKLGIPVMEGNIHKEELYIAEEAFFSGTAAEITPIINIDGIKIGSGSSGQITKKISEYYESIVSGKAPESKDWLTKVQ
ncbi:MAG: branched-chain amino acid transaminase [Candidatus Micrarchaeales archaeon]|uniref:Branched-chain-amino-acid aminotransferase n=1 Tax=Candidatus Micrarchaeum acidiphilum ARMAN-2 TaxID=425595 RepID=C7DIT1_MICA2|nr:MAG: branched-chain amino acid aminotransferase [Candidatus Micrarchaeum acidiphilum ARMAN-2]MCW6161322.1 branched-chain amino acid transaminase [Candidatus Micrarchaeales archaeon]